ncbi:MAG: hypothetical protein JWR35_657 [Marmoricola sp.]|jgi:hypothetical protein|nr:hypothetical protein [Marmoricola sp.]
METSTLPIPSYDGATVVVPAPGAGPGNWTGAASAVLEDGVFWLTYRVRRPLTDGRGVTVVVASSGDGERFRTVAEVHREQFGTESFERPALVKVPGIGWRLYLSCATYGSKHWWVDSLTAATPEELPTGHRQLVLPGDSGTAVKDPVIRRADDGWDLWLCCHPLDRVGDEDRMTTRHLTSPDGLAWTDRGEVLAGRPRSWDARGARITAVIGESPLTVLYDGRADAESNWHERTGVAEWDGSRFLSVDDEPRGVSPYSDGALRYATAVALPDGRTRFYFEAARPDGAHDLLTCVR